MMRLRRVISIDILRIICCISVYTQHFFGMAIDESKPAVNFYRSSVWFKSILGFFSSEMVLMAFFVTGGFFIPAAITASDDTDSILLKMIRKCLNILVPGLAVVLMTAGITAVMKPLGLSDIFDIRELGKDIFKMIVGIPGDVYIHFGYPLWFQHFMFVGYIAGFLFLAVFCRYRRLKYLSYVSVLLYTLFNSPYVFLVICGMLAGELCYGAYSEAIHRKLNREPVCIILILISVSAMPLIFDTAYERARVCGPIGLMFVILLAALYNLELTAHEKGRLNDKEDHTGSFFRFLSNNTYACYLVHFAVYCSALRILYRISLNFDFLWRNKAVGCIVLYILITPVLWLVSAAFTRFVISPLKRSYSTVIDHFEKRYING